MKRTGPLRLAVLISGRGSNMLAIADACVSGQLNARIVQVIADRYASADSNLPVAGIDAATRRGLMTQTLAAKRYASGADFEAALTSAVLASSAEWLILAGFMRVLSADFVARFAGRILNIHPSLLPAFKGLHTHRQALSAGVSHHGCSIHIVTAGLDSGPVIAQAQVPVLASDDELSLSARVQRVEHRLYPRVLGWLAADRLQCRDGDLWLDGQPLTTPRQESFDVESI